MILKNYKNLKFFFLLFIIIINFIIFFFLQNKFVQKSFNISNFSVCSNDGMFLLDYDGPKAQIIWDNGDVSFFCEPREAFYEFFNNINKKKIKFFFVQDFSKLSWGSYIDNWILAEKSFFVIDSDKNGSMGITYVPFSEYASALSFQAIYGGEVIFFSQISLKSLIKSNELLKNRLLIDL